MVINRPSQSPTQPFLGSALRDDRCFGDFVSFRPFRRFRFGRVGGFVSLFWVSTCLLAMEERKVKIIAFFMFRWFRSGCFGGSGGFVPVVPVVPAVSFRWFRSGVPVFSTCPKTAGK